MSFRLAVLLLSAVAFTLSASIPAEAAKARKHKRGGAPTVAMVQHGGGQWGTNLVRGGLLYNGPDYLGTDPDPNIRFQILRDLTGRYGGGSN
jgi:hypothetical protein